PAAADRRLDSAQRRAGGRRLRPDGGGRHRLGGPSWRILRRAPALWRFRPALDAAGRIFRVRGIGALRVLLKSKTIASDGGPDRATTGWQHTTGGGWAPVLRPVRG